LGGSKACGRAGAAARAGGAAGGGSTVGPPTAPATGPPTTGRPIASLLVSRRQRGAVVRARIYVGRALRDFTSREEIVLATKVNGPMRPGPNGAGLSRKAIMAEIDASLTRLGTDYVDLYQVHRFDPTTPLEETLEALHDVVKSGKARYIGASSMFAWQFAKALHLQDANGWARFVTMQNHYNLVYREEEREVNPLCRDEGLGLLPWSPLARGFLAGNRSGPGGEEDRPGQTDGFTEYLYEPEVDVDVIDRLAEVAEAEGEKSARVALAWLLHKPGVTAPILGAPTPEHLEDPLAAAQLSLSREETERLDEPYLHQAVAGHGG